MSGRSHLLHSVAPWTGSASDGTELVEDGVSRAVGESRVGYGAPGADPLHSSFTAANTEMRPLYVLMPPFEIGFPLLVSSFKQAGGSESDLSARRSQRFATGANLHGYELRQVNIQYSDSQRDPFSVDLYTVNPAGQPDTLIETLDPPADFHFALANHVFHPPGNTVLAANTTYALVVRPDSQGTNLGLGATSYDSEDTASVDDWSIEDAFDIEDGGSWAADADGDALAFEIRGVVRVGTSLAPTGLTATAMGLDRIDLSWTAPTDDGGSAVTGYRIESSADGSAGWTDLVADTVSTDTTYSHTGLMPNTTRHYRVSAINGEGTSEPSGTANATTDYPEVTVQFDGGPYTVAEGGTQTVTVVLSEDPLQNTVIPLMATGQNGAQSGDYTIPPSVTFSTGQTYAPFTFTATHDTVDDDGESVRLTFGPNLPSKVSVGTMDETTVSITDDDAPAGVTVAFEQATYRVIEGDGVSVTVSLNDDPERTVVIPLVVTNQGGASDSDHSGVPERVTFNSGDTSTSFTLTAADDNLNETGERVRIAFGALPSTPIPVTAGSPAETTVTINGKSGQDMNTPPTVHFGSAMYSVAEGNTVAVTVELSKAPGSDVVIPLTATEQGNATFGDYSGVPVDLTFTAADTEETFTFEATQDMEDDDDESVLLGFSGLPDGITTTAGRASQTTVSITDDDDPQVTVQFGARRLHGRGGRDPVGHRHLERGPGAHGGHLPHGDGPGQRGLHRLFRADQRDLRRGGD